jgi:nitroreductase
MQYNKEEFNQIIRNRRSIFPADYTGEKVPDQVVEQMLENANWAPTHKFTEPWRFKVFTGEGLKKLGEIQSTVYQQVTTTDGTFTQKKYENLLQKPLSASHVIVIAMKRDQKNSVPVSEEISAVACAVQNMYLTAEVYGIGCYWGTGGITYFEESKTHFGLEEEDKLMGFFYIGIPKKWPLAAKRTPANEKVEWIRK